MYYVLCTMHCVRQRKNTDTLGYAFFTDMQDTHNFYCGHALNETILQYLGERGKDYTCTDPKTIGAAMCTELLTRMLHTVFVKFWNQKKNEAARGFRSFRRNRTGCHGLTSSLEILAQHGLRKCQCTGIGPARLNLAALPRPLVQGTPSTGEGEV